MDLEKLELRRLGGGKGSGKRGERQHEGRVRVAIAELLLELRRL